MPAAAVVGSDADKRVFLNIPYDEEFQPLYLTYMVGLVALGMTPVLTLEEAGGKTRLDRLVNLLRSCRYSVHDLSRVQLSTAGGLPRFNMPFELGLAVALASASDAHQWFGFDSVRFQAQRTLSDLAGSDFYAHQNDPKRALAGLCDAFVRERRPSVPRMMETVDAVTRMMPRLLQLAGSDSPFGARMFQDLVQAARDSLAEKPLPGRRI